MGFISPRSLQKAVIIRIPPTDDEPWTVALAYGHESIEEAVAIASDGGVMAVDCLDCACEYARTLLRWAGSDRLAGAISLNADLSSGRGDA